MSDNPILRPVENAEGWTRGGFDVSGRESNPHLLVFTRCSNAVELPSSITKAQRPIPKGTADKRRHGNPASCGWRGVRTRSRFPASPITQTQRPVEIGAPDGHRTTSPGLTSGVLSPLNYRTVRESAQTSSADRGCGFFAVLGRVRWASGVIERRHSMPGIEPGPSGLSPRTVRPPYGGG